MMSHHVHSFVSLVYPAQSSWIALCLIPPDAQGAEHRFTPVDRLSRFLPYARYRNVRGWGVYVTPSVLKPASTNRRKSSFQQQQRVIYLDCDRPDCLDRIRERYPDPTVVARTSKRRHQVYWRLDQPVDVAAQQQLMSAMAVDVGADQAATDVARVLRLPGFWNRKPGRNNTVDLVFTCDHAVTYQSLWRPAQPSRTGAILPSRPTSTGRSSPAVLGGSQSERDWYEVHRRLALGHPAENVVSWLQAQRTDKPDPAYYARYTVTKAVQTRSNHR
jgi:hypothetical protein